MRSREACSACGTDVWRSQVQCLARRRRPKLVQRVPENNRRSAYVVRQRQSAPRGPQSLVWTPACRRPPLVNWAQDSGSPVPRSPAWTARSMMQVHTQEPAGARRSQQEPAGASMSPAGIPTIASIFSLRQFGRPCTSSITRHFPQSRLPLLVHAFCSRRSTLTLALRCSPTTSSQERALLARLCCAGVPALATPASGLPRQPLHFIARMEEEASKHAQGEQQRSTYPAPRTNHVLDSCHKQARNPVPPWSSHVRAFLLFRTSPRKAAPIPHTPSARLLYVPAACSASDASRYLPIHPSILPSSAVPDPSSHQSLPFREVFVRVRNEASCP